MAKELQAINQEHTISLWAERISACQNSNLSVAHVAVKDKTNPYYVLKYARIAKCSGKKRANEYAGREQTA